MATATASGIAYGVMNMDTKPPLKPDILAIAKKIYALKALTRDTGFVTGKSVGALLSPLSNEQLTQVAEALEALKKQ